MKIICNYRIIVFSKFFAILFVTFFCFRACAMMSCDEMDSIAQKLTSAHLRMMEKCPDKAEDPRYLLGLQNAIKTYRTKTKKSESFEGLASILNKRWNEVQTTRPVN